MAHRLDDDDDDDDDSFHSASDGESEEPPKSVPPSEKIEVDVPKTPAQESPRTPSPDKDEEERRPKLPTPEPQRPSPTEEIDVEQLSAKPSTPVVATSSAKPPKSPEQERKIVQLPEEEKEAEVAEDLGDWDDWGEKKTDNASAKTDNASAKPTTKQTSEDIDWNDDNWGESGNDDKKQPAASPHGASSASSSSVKPEQTLKDVTASTWRFGASLLGAVGETVSSALEQGLGLPKAEEVARAHREEEDRLRKTAAESEQSATSASAEKSRALLDELADGGGASSKSGGAAALFSGILGGGIDVLEQIGRKTFEAVTVQKESGAGRRLRFGADNEDVGQSLSAALKEMRARDEVEKAATRRPPTLALLFERGDGMAHLESLELLVDDATKPSSAITRRVDAIDTDRRLTDGLFAQQIEEACRRTGLANYKPQAAIAASNNAEKQYEILSDAVDRGDRSPAALFSISLHSLAALTAAGVQTLGKLAHLHLSAQVQGEGDFTSEKADKRTEAILKVTELCARRCNTVAGQCARKMERMKTTIDQQDDEFELDAESGATQLLVESAGAVDMLKHATRLVLTICGGGSGKR